MKGGIFEVVFKRLPPRLKCKEAIWAIATACAVESAASKTETGTRMAPAVGHADGTRGPGGEADPGPSL
jgi:hypothetical protein